MPEYTGDITAIGTIRFLEAIRKSGVKTRFYQASSSEMYGSAQAPQNELTPFEPRSPYAAAKVYAYWVVRNYREAYHLFSCNGIFGGDLCDQKNNQGRSQDQIGASEKIIPWESGFTEGRGYAQEYVEAMWLMLHQKNSVDYVIATGETHTVEEFLELAFKEVGLEKFDSNVVEVNLDLFRPAEVWELRGDYSKANKELGWEPKVKFKELIKIMVEYELQKINYENKA